MKKALHCVKVTAWIAISSSVIIRLCFYEVGGATATVTSDKNKFLPELRRRGMNLQDVYFQLDGAAPQYRKVLEWL